MLFGNPDFFAPTKSILIPTSDSNTYDTGTSKFGAIVGDESEIGMHSAIGPGVIIGRKSRIGSMVRLTPGIYPDEMRIRDAGFKVIETGSVQID